MENLSKDNDACKIEKKTLKSKSLITLVKSFYIFKLIISYLSENRKLNIIKYNKNIRNQFDINIEYIKKISGKYKIKGLNGIEKEYALNTNILLFEDKYLNGKRNGQGKEYKEGKIVYGGEYLNGKRNGKAKKIMMKVN